MLKQTIMLFIVLLISFPVSSYASRYGKKLCNHPNYSCLKVKRGENWRSLFPDESQRELIMRLNRMNSRLRRGTILAIPDNSSWMDHMDLSPFPRRIEPRGNKLILINMKQQAFGAYDYYGYLQHWGPISGGRGWCPDIRRACRTPKGVFHIRSKRGRRCASKKYPVPNGGAPMPYCMFFYGGYAMHGGILPGRHASHGCIRLFTQDAKWLNKNFVNTGNNGTQVIIRSELESANFLAFLT